MLFESVVPAKNTMLPCCFRCCLGKYGTVRCCSNTNQNTMLLFGIGGMKKKHYVGMLYQNTMLPERNDIMLLELYSTCTLY